MKTLNVLGLNSGTSMDGVDAAAFRITPVGHGNGDKPPSLKAEALHSELVEFEPGFGKRLHKLVNSGQASLAEVCLLNTALGEVFAAAATRIARTLAAKGEQLDLIGSHGQTVWHEPEAKDFWGIQTKGTLQLGDGAVIAARTGLPVISDFRSNDIAWGGQGAPLVSYADEVLFGHEGRPLGVLNIGGIANLTVLDKTGRAKFAYDTGPGNMLIDRAAERFFQKSFDEDGKLAGSGIVNEEWLKELKTNPYFKMAPPKTTGREAFGHKFADNVIEEAQAKGISKEDTIATLTALTAMTIAESYRDYVSKEVKVELIVSGGGGANNATLLRFLQKYWPHELSIKPHEDFGISTKFKESLLFALLAYTTYFGIPNNVPGCTGARRQVCLGKITK